MLLGVQEPRLSHIPDGDTERGDRAVEFARWCGLTLFPWQEELLRDMCRTDEQGIWSAREVVTVVARQNGKGEVLVARELAGIYLFGEKEIFHSAHFMDTAIDAQKRLWEVIENNDNLFYWWEDDPQTPGVPAMGKTNGKENVTFPNGSIVYFRTRTKKTGRGLSVDLLILDECFDLPKETYAALGKLIRAVESAQAVFISSPVNRMEHFHGAVFSAKRWAGIDGSKRVLFKEWSPAEDDDPFEKSTWAKCNPSMVDSGPGAQLSDIESDAEAAKNSEVLLEAFLVETLGQGDWYPRDGDTVDEIVPLVNLAEWQSLVRNPVAPSASCVGIEVAVDGSCVGFVAAMQDGDKVLLSLSPMVEFERSTAVAATARAVDNNDPLGVVLDPIGQSSTLIDPLEDIGVDATKLRGSQSSAAFELLMRMLHEGAIVHDGNQRWLDAWAVAQEKAGRYRSFARRAEVVPLIAASYAVWGLRELRIPEAPEVKKTKRFTGTAKPVAAKTQVAEMAF